MDTIAFILKGYPRLSETFIAKEIAGLERLGLKIHIVSLRFPTDTKRHPVHGRIQAPVLYLPEYLYQEIPRVWRAWREIRKTPHYKATRAVWLRDLWRDKTPNRVRRFGQALVLAAELPAGVRHLHGHFLHTPGSVTRYTAMLCGLDWTVSAHAKDIWTIPNWEVREKISATEWLACCSQAAYDHLHRLIEDEQDRQKIHLMYHGLDLSDFDPPNAAAEKTARGNDDADPVRILSVGRAVAKKGYPELLEAFAALPPSCQWQFEHIGGGPLLPALKQQARKLGLEARIHWRGSMAQREILDAYRRADIFTLASRIELNGDRDGLPNVLLEAGSQGMAIAATAVSGIPELVEHEITGLLVPERDVAALTAALERLISDPVLRRRLGQAVRDKIHRQFDDKVWIEALAARFDRTIDLTPALAARNPV